MQLPSFTNFHETLHEHIKNDLLTLIIIWLICLSPAIVMTLLWMLLDPSGFWQKLAMLVVSFTAAPFQIGGIIFGGIATNEYQKELKMKRLKK